MSDIAPDKHPEPQPKSSGGPPKPPKKTARDLLDGAGQPGGAGDVTQKVISVTTYTCGTWSELMKLNGGGRPRIRESLEVELDGEIVLLADLAQSAIGADHKIVIDWLNLLRDYRGRHPRLNPSNPEQAQQAQEMLHAAPQV
jgi:hypothetical protein